MRLIFLAIGGYFMGKLINQIRSQLYLKKSNFLVSLHDLVRSGSSPPLAKSLALKYIQIKLQGTAEESYLPKFPRTLEALTASLWISASLSINEQLVNLTPDSSLFAGILLISILIPLAMIDFEYMYLPEPLCRWGVVAGLFITGATTIQIGAKGGCELFLDHLLASASALLAMEALSAIAEKLLNKQSLGPGDAKFAALGGAWLGLNGVWTAITLAFLAGALISLAGKISGFLKPAQPFPFGPLIAIGIWGVWLCNPSIW